MIGQSVSFSRGCASARGQAGANVEAMTHFAGPQWTRRKLLSQMILGSRQAPWVGSVETIADQMIEWCLQADIDGFNLSRTVVPECFDDFIELVVPQLQERGAYKTQYTPGTFRNKLFDSIGVAGVGAI